MPVEIIVFLLNVEKPLLPHSFQELEATVADIVDVSFYLYVPLWEKKDLFASRYSVIDVGLCQKSDMERVRDADLHVAKINNHSIIVHK